jgi:phosphinothricin acetyltransferase
MTATIRVATPQDATAILTIYTPIVRDTAISFEVEPPTLAEMQHRIAQTLQRLPWLVCDWQGEVLGYVYASSHRARAAYQWSVDVSVYIHQQARRTGMGQALYTSLFQLLTLQGFYQCYAGITLPNPPSVGLHESLGFYPVGVYESVGYKLGAWHDVGWWQRGLQPCTRPPSLPTPFEVLQQTSTTWDAALTAGLPLLRGKDFVRTTDH